MLFRQTLSDISAPTIDVRPICIIINSGVSVGSATYQKSTKLRMVAFSCDLEFTAGQ